MSTELPTELLRRRLGADHRAGPHGADHRAGPHGAGPHDVGPDAGEPDTSLSRWLPENAAQSPAGWIARIRADPGRAGVVALGVIGAVAVLVTVVSLLRDGPPAVVSAKLPPVEMVSSSAPTSGSAAPAASAPVVVSVVGLVHTPGLVTLPAGARTADALDAAGGALDGADVMGLNMARRLTDGEQIVVGIAAPPGKPVEMGSSIVADAAAAPSASTPPESASEAGEAIDLNAATVEQLDTLPGVGPVTAAAIIAWRDAHGRFESVEQLGDVDGIGPARLDKLRDRVRV
jgi:competence protein ComEA